MIATATNNGYFMWLEPYVFPDLENKNAVDTLNEYVPYQILYGQGFGYGSLLESRYGDGDNKTNDANSPTSANQTQRASLEDISGAVSAGTGAIAVISEVFKGSDEKKRIRAACGVKPLVNKQKKEKYQQCVQALYAPQQSMRTREDEGMKTSTIILIVVGALLLVGGVITFVILSKKK